MASITRTPTGQWRVRWTDPAGRRRSRTAGSDIEALTLAIQIEDTDTPAEVEAERRRLVP